MSRSSSLAFPPCLLLRRPLQSLTISRSGELVVELGDGAAIRASASARGDSWEVVGAGRMEGMSYRGHADGRAPWE